MKSFTTWFNRDVLRALTVTLLVSLLVAYVWLSTGCYGYNVHAEFEHHSSIPDMDDLATADQIGVCVLYPLAESEYATEVEVCAHKEVGGAEVFGRDPVGTVRIRQPLLKHRR